ncbi:hypothetical protein BH10PSE2_BH10PSE2_08210 [soil metagenome]
MTRKTPTTLSPVAWTQIRDAYLAGECAAVICEQYDVSLASLRRRAREEGWRRSDATEDPARVATQIDLEAYAAALGLGDDDHDDDDDDDDLAGPDFEDPTILAEMSLLRVSTEVLAGRVTSALRWTRLYRELKAIGVARAKEAALAKTACETLETPVSECLAPVISDAGHTSIIPVAKRWGDGAAPVQSGDEKGDAISRVSDDVSPPLPHGVAPSVASTNTPPIHLRPSFPPTRRPKWDPVAALAIIDARIAREKREAMETLETRETLETPVFRRLDRPAKGLRLPPSDGEGSLADQSH